MLDNNLKSIDKFYKSPHRKLIRFFERSRNRWKAKCLMAKHQIKLLSNKIRYLEKRQANLKSKVKELEKQIEELREKTINNAGADKFDIVPSFHTYSIAHIRLFLEFVLSGGASLRGASRIVGIILSFLGLNKPTPSWYAGRFWLLRLGYYKLERAKEQASDWIWIVDHTVQLGSEKCLVILGIRQSSLPAVELHLSHEDVEPIALLPVTESNGAIVYEQLVKTVEKTGVPRQIIGDHGPDIKAGVERFCRQHQTTCYSYDIKHKGAAILKRELQDNEEWIKFTQNATRAARKVQQTHLIAFAPPNQRSKARYMNVDKLVRWGQDLLNYLDRGIGSGDHDLTGMDEKLGWLREYRDQMISWNNLVNVVDSAVEFVRSVGIYRHCSVDLETAIEECVNDERANRVRDELISFVEQQSLNAREGEVLLGSSEVIESAIGKFKTLEQDQAKSGFTSMLLSFAAFLSKTTQDVIQMALQVVPTKKVLEWFKENIGQSVQAQRKQFLKVARATE